MRYARWDLSCVDLYDERHGTRLCVVMPLDKASNADRRRRVREAPAPAGDATTPTPMPEPEAIAPRLRELMAQYAATGLPPAYVPRAATPSDATAEAAAQTDPSHEEASR